MSNQNIHDQLIPLSALLLAVEGVQEIAKTGQWDEKNFKTLISSLLIRNASKIEDNYPDIGNLDKGRQLVIQMLEGTLDKQLLYYVFHVIAVEKKLSNNAVLNNTLLEELTQIERQVEYFDLLHDTIFAKLAEIYQNTASQCAKKIRIIGKIDHLQRPELQNKVRTALLCAVRASVLWRANGGSRLRFVFGKQKLLDVAKSLEF